MSVAVSDTDDENDFTLSPTEAEKRVEGYILRGTRRLVTNAPVADRFILLCCEPGEGLITLMSRGKRQEGIGVCPIEKMGLKLTPSGDIDLREVRVSLENRVGKEGEGGLHSEHYRQERGLRNIAQALGAAQGTLISPTQYARQREQFGRRLIQFQVIRHKLAEMAAELERVRCLAYRAAGDYDGEG